MNVYFQKNTTYRHYAARMVAAVDTPAVWTETAAHDAMVAARWPDGVQCPRCGSDAVSERRLGSRTGWRCRACRADFTVTTGTRLHSSKAPAAAWATAAVDGAAVGVSDASARRMRRVVESTGLPSGPRRLAALLAAPSGPVERGPLDGLAAGPRRILAMLRTRAAGATPARIAAETGLSLSHTRRCLRTLRSEGLVETETLSVMWGYRPRRLRLWRLRICDRTIAALPQMGWRPPAPEPPAAGVPGEFWWLFWSGECASQLRIPEDAVHIADTLIGGPDPAARAWALEMLPLWTLRELRAMRGYDAGEAARWLDFTIRERQGG